MRFLFFIYSIVMNITCLFRTWPYSCIWLRNIKALVCAAFTRDSGFPYLDISRSSRAKFSYYYHVTYWEFFTSALADDLSLEFEWQQISSSLQDSSQYSGRSQYCSSLDGFHSSSYFKVLQSLYQSFGDCNKSTNFNWYNCHFHVRQFCQFPSKIQVLILSFNFTRCSSGTAKSTVLQVLFFLLFFFCWL